MPNEFPVRTIERAEQREIREILASALDGEQLDIDEIQKLLSADGPTIEHIAKAADMIRMKLVGDVVTYVKNRNINFTNICVGSCRFCGFKRAPDARDAYVLDVTRIQKKVVEAVRAGATEVCLQGGLHPEFGIEHYVRILKLVRTSAPHIHIHAFSPAEIDHICKQEGMDVSDVLMELQSAGLDSMPGTAAEILVDRVRALICPQKIKTKRWVEIMRTAHELGIPTTATVLYGTVETPRELARHLILIREIQADTMGFTEFIPLAFIPYRTPLSRQGIIRPPPLSYSKLVHAVARLAFLELIPNIQASWVKLGPDNAALMLCAGANDLGGTLMEENITRAAGGAVISMTETKMRNIIRSINRIPKQRTTLYEILN